VPDDRILWNWTALMRFADFPTINFAVSNAADLRLHSRHLVGIPMGNRQPMTRRDGASYLPNLNEVCETPQDGQSRTPKVRGPTIADFKNVSPTEI
jgi:hypothetical protein